jgi:DNA mismatch repair protein MutL
MNDIIHLLPDRVANQIAAGEVIQRPASVVKELVENAIDAEAKSIEVIIVDAGRTIIQVIDDGKGMSATDARLSFERHATSKIHSADDLFTLHTMGFRGEALASIAAVSQVELCTRPHDDELGTKLVIEGSHITDEEPETMPAGSNFLIRNLFYNVPARRKFLKSNQTEMSNILADFERIVLVYPQLEFSLSHNNVELFKLPPTSLRERIIHVFGKRINEKILDIDVNTSLVNIKGFVGKPETARKNGNHQYFFVNGRYMRHPYFHRAVMEAYDKLIPIGYGISYFIYFEVDPSHIDVNIHPTKTEIKFEDEQSIWQIILAAVRESIGKYSDVPSIDFNTDGKPSIPVFNPNISVQSPQIKVNPNFNPFAGNNEHHSNSAGRWDKLYPANETISSTRFPSSIVETDPSQSIDNNNDTELFSDVTDKSALHYQFKGRFILTSVKSGLMVVEQHYAHIRILYDRYMEYFKQRHGVSQGLLFPEVITLPPSMAEILKNILADLKSIGFEISDTGQGNFSILGVPEGTEGIRPVDLVQNMVDAAQNRDGILGDEIQSIIALSLAKRSAIVIGQVLSNEEMDNLIDSLFACSTPKYTPDGNLVFYIIPEKDIEHFFN